MSQHKQIFLSYRSVEVDFALKLAADLKNAGIALWIDRLDIKPGSDWRKSLQNAVNNCAAMISIITPEYVTSRYCQRELARADRMGRPIIPVLLRTPSDTEWPFEIERQQYIDFSNWRDESTYQARFEYLVSILHDQFADQVHPTPDPETQYLNRLIAELEAHKGITEYIELTTQSEYRFSEIVIRPEPRFAEAWTLQGAFSVLTQSSDGETITLTLNGITEALEQFPRFVLVGRPGTGKTTTLQYLALNAARARLIAPSSTALPIFLKLANWTKESSVEEFIRESWSFEGDPIALLHHGYAQLYLDGLNEMGSLAEQHTALLREWLNAHNAPEYVIVTCRLEDYGDVLDLGLPVVQALAMNRTRIEEFVTTYLGEVAARQLLFRMMPDDDNPIAAQSILQLASNPFLLTVLVMMYQSNPEAELPLSKGALLRQLAAELWHQENARQSDEMLPFDTLEIALAQLAFKMIDEQMPIYVPYEYALQHMGDISFLHSAISARFLEQQGQHVRFSHQLMQEYFAALGLRNSGLPTRLVQPQFDGTGQRVSDAWDAVIIMLCDIASSPDSGVRAVAEIDPYLAIQCIVAGVQIADNTREYIAAQVLGALTRNTESHIAVLAALVALQHDSAYPLLLDAMREGSWQTRTQALNLFSTLPRRTLPGLIDVLREPEASVRAAASMALRQIGSESLPSLIQSLQDDNWAARRGAAWAMGELGNFAAVPALVNSLADEDAVVRAEAASALGLIRDPDSVTSLVVVLSDENWRVRKAAAQALSRIGKPALDALITALDSPSTEVRRLAIESLKSIEDRAVLPALLKISYDQSAEVRGAAIEAFTNMEDLRVVKRLIESLSDTAKSRSSKQRIAEIAAKVLETITLREARVALQQWKHQNKNHEAVVVSTGTKSAPRGKQRLQAITAPPAPQNAIDRFRELNNPDWSVRRRAVESLCDVEASVALPKLLIALKDEEMQVRLAAVSQLSTLKNEVARDALLSALADSDTHITDAAADVLHRWGKFAIPGLLKALKSKNANIRGAAVEILGRIKDGVAVPALVETLADTAHPWLAEERVCDLAARALLAIGSTEACVAVQTWRNDGSAGVSDTPKRPSVTVEELRRINQREILDEEPPHREQIVELLHRIRQGEWGEQQEAAKALRDIAKNLHGKEASLEIQRLISALEDPEWVVRWAACEALAWIGDKSVVPALKKRIGDDNWMVRIATIRALTELGDKSALDGIRAASSDSHTNVREAVAEAIGILGDNSAIPSLTALLQDDEQFVRLAAVESLGRISGKGALRALVTALSDPDRHVRWAAAEALDRIGDKSVVFDLIARLQDTEGPYWEDKRVCDVVAHALERIGTPEAVAAVNQWRRGHKEYR